MKKKYSLKSLTFYFVTALLLVSQVSIAQNKVYEIDDPKDLQDVFYQPGDVIILEDGTYDSDGRMKFIGSGTAENPVVFRAETPGGVIFTGGMQMYVGGETDEDTGEKLATGEYLVIDGLYWKGGYGSNAIIQFRNGDDYAHHSTFQNCVMDGLTVDPDDEEDGKSEKHNWIELYGTFNTVINCSFMNKTNAGNMILVELAYNAYPEVPEGEEEINTSCDLVGHTISNNYFYKYTKTDATLTNAGDSEAIRIGTSSYQNVNSGATVSNNYFVEADGENEIITNKSKNNKYINNTFRRSRGSLVLRHGSNATVEGNYFLGENVDGTGGIRIVDSEHTVKNNYIQDCITVIDQSKWNNGITFMGGNTDGAVDCNSDDTSSGYQYSKDITVSNNTIVNTNAPLFYNTDKGTDNVTGTVSNNLIYFQEGNDNISPVIVGEDEDSYSDIGKSLTYNGNVYSGTTLGETNDGFSLEEGITASEDGEIFTFSGADGKGANMGSYKPTTNDMVGYGIGACFVDYSGEKITDGDCTIEIPESIIVSSLPLLPYNEASYEVVITANVGWEVTDIDVDWITSVDPSSGTGDATVLVSVDANLETTQRTGIVTIKQVAGGDDIERTLIVTQDGVEPTFGLTLINDLGNGEDGVIVNSFSMEEVTATKSNYAINSLDKKQSTNWSSEGTTEEPSFIIYDLGAYYDLEVIDFASTKGKTYDFQVRVSSTGLDDEDFSNPFEPGNLISSDDNTFKSFPLPSVAPSVRYVKILGYGQPNGSGSNWTSITEIDFYGELAASLSINDFDFNKNVLVYPIPAKNTLNIKMLEDKGINNVKIFSIDGRLVIEKQIEYSNSALPINVEGLATGSYILNLSGTEGNVSKMILITD